MMSDRKSVLVVSEDPTFIANIRERFAGIGAVVACVGPGDGRCNLDLKGACRLVDHADVAIVDPPPSGAFSRAWHKVPATDYAERIAAHYPETFVILCGVPDPYFEVNPEVAVALDRESGVELSRWALHVRGYAPA